MFNFLQIIGWILFLNHVNSTVSSIVISKSTPRYLITIAIPVCVIFKQKNDIVYHIKNKSFRQIQKIVSLVNLFFFEKNQSINQPINQSNLTLLIQLQNMRLKSSSKNEPKGIKSTSNTKLQLKNFSVWKNKI